MALSGREVTGLSLSLRGPPPPPPAREGWVGRRGCVPESRRAPIGSLWAAHAFALALALALAFPPATSTSSSKAKLFVATPAEKARDETERREKIVGRRDALLQASHPHTLSHRTQAPSSCTLGERVLCVNACGELRVSLSRACGAVADLRS